MLTRMSLGKSCMPVNLRQNILLLSSQEEWGYTCPKFNSFGIGNLPVSASCMFIIASCYTLFKLHLEHLGIPQQALCQAV